MPSRKRSGRRIQGEHFREDGSPKRRFASEREALDHVRRFGHNCFPYRCTVCDGWHLATRRTPRLF
jgi:hypothetical protein